MESNCPMKQVLDTNDVFVNNEDKLLVNTKENVQIISGNLFLTYYAKKLLKSSIDIKEATSHLSSLCKTFIENGYCNEEVTSMVSQVIDNHKKKNTFTVKNIINKNKHLFPSINMEGYNSETDQVEMFGKVVQDTFNDLNTRFSKLFYKG